MKQAWMISLDKSDKSRNLDIAITKQLKHNHEDIPYAVLYIDEFMREKRNSSVLAMELHLSFINLWLCL